MSERPLVPLRWYEVLLLRFLANSPRIVQIHVMQHSPDGDEDPESDLSPRDRQRREEYIDYLEALYHGPSSWD